MYRVIVIIVILLYSTRANADIPCAARSISGASVVCVCNSTYCDTITRQPPDPAHYVAYVTTKSGLRFNKITGLLQPTTYSLNKNKLGCGPILLDIDPEVKYQRIEGFGGAITDAAAINWRDLSTTLQKYLIDSYFSTNGLEYNMIRTPIGGSDFSTRGYAYNDLPVNDRKLSNFSLAYEDYQYKMPMMKAAIQTAKTPIHVVATTWSPPVWMKTSQQYTGFGYLKPEFYQTYADYHLKFIEKYTNEGVPIWGITTTNEPTNCVVGISPINCLGWTAASLGQWIINNLGPTVRNSTFKDVKILAGDDQRLTLPYWVNAMIAEHPKVLQYMDGVAVHYYSDRLAPAALLAEVARAFPDKFILATEACEGFLPWEKKVKFGSWQRAKNYIKDIITDMTHSVVGWIDWNLCLNATGGPNWVDNFTDSPIIVFPERGEFVKQPMYYALGHFSKFVPRGSRRIKLTQKSGIFTKSVDSVAFLTPNNTVVVVLFYDGPSTSATIRLGDNQAVFNVAKDSIVTIELPYKK